MRTLFFGVGALAALSASALVACGDDETAQPANCTPNLPVVCECPGGKSSTGVTTCVTGDPRTYVQCECDPSVASSSSSSGSGGQGGSGPVCAPEETVCSNVCVDLAVDDKNCGKCGTVCPKGTACNASVCDCLKATEALCGDTCFDIYVDGKNCGGCGHDCLGGKCVGGVCEATKLADGVDEPYGLAVDDTYLYWTSSGTKNSVFRKKLADASAPETLASNQKVPREVALASDAAYSGVVWTNFGLADQGASVMGVKLGAMAPAPLATSAKDGVWSLEVSGTTAFYLNRDEGELWSVDLTASGDPAMLGKKLASALTQPWDLATDGAFVYFTNYAGGELRRVAASGGTQKILVKSLGNPTGVALDAKYAYYATENTGEVAKVIQDGSAAPTTLAKGQQKPAHVLVDGGFVYWTSYGSSDTDGAVSKVSVDGGDVVVLAAAQNKPLKLAVDATHVYWTTFGGKTLMKAPK